MHIRKLALVIAAFGVTGCGGGGGKDAGAGYTTPTGPSGGGTSGTTAPNTIVATDGLAFTPSTLNVSKGTTVTFVFQATGHSVGFTGAGAPTSIPETSNTSVQRTFTTSGSFSFTCSIHSYMYGTITVQ